jgi:acyl dehydratase
VLNLQALIGRESTPVVNEIEKGAIRKFADAIGDDNPLYRDAEYAATTRYGRIIAPPTFCFTLEHGETGGGISIKDDGMIHGEQVFRYERPIYAGDVLQCSMKITDAYQRKAKSGTLTFVVFEGQGINQDGQHCYTSVLTLIVPPKEEEQA